MIIKKYDIRKVLFFILCQVIFSCILSLFCGIISSTPDYKGTTRGVNLIMGANDNMNGTYNSDVFNKGKMGYIHDKTNVYEKDSIWTLRSIQWIKSHKIKFLSYMPIKLFRLWGGDYYSDINFNISSVTSLNVKILKICIFSFFYYMSCFLFLVGIFALRKKILGVYGIILIPLVLASLMHCVLYGGMRYHYPYIPIFIFYASKGLLYLLDKINIQYKKEKKLV